MAYQRDFTVDMYYDLGLPLLVIAMGDETHHSAHHHTRHHHIFCYYVHSEIILFFN